MKAPDTAPVQHEQVQEVRMSHLRMTIKAKAATNQVKLHPPNHWACTFRSITVRFNSVGAGARRIKVEVCDEDGERVWATIADRNQTGPQVYWYFAFEGSPHGHAGDALPEHWMLMPPELDIPKGGFIRAYDANNINPVGDSIFLAVWFDHAVSEKNYVDGIQAEDGYFIDFENDGFIETEVLA